MLYKARIVDATKKNRCGRQSYRYYSTQIPVPAVYVTCSQHGLRSAQKCYLPCCQGTISPERRHPPSRLQFQKCPKNDKKNSSTEVTITFFIFKQCFGSTYITGSGIQYRMRIRIQNTDFRYRPVLALYRTYTGMYGTCTGEIFLLK
jgi:hypothetical protein